MTHRIGTTRRARRPFGRWALAAALGLPPSAAAALVAAAPGAAGAAATCSPAGSTGLTAAVVATSSTTYSSAVDATGCDVGIFVGPGVHDVTIDGASVTGANDHGIFAEDAGAKLVIAHSTVTGNGVHPTPGIAENKAIEVVGTSNALIENNTVTGNVADGGIGIADDGAIDPGAPNPGTSSAATGDTVVGNISSVNYGGCGIVVASYNASGVSDITIGGAGEGNTVAGSPHTFSAHGPVVGGIVVAADTPGAKVTGVTVQGNTVQGSGIPGVVVHANAPGDVVTGVRILGNTITGNDWLVTDGPPQAAGVVVAASPIPPPAGPVLSGTVVNGNTITGQFVGVWIAGATGTDTTTVPNTISVPPGGTPVFTVPPAGSGYTMAARDGGVFTFGQAGYHGSLPALGVRVSDVVGMAPTTDQGGYWLAGADGGVYAFGDAPFEGSLGGRALAAPIVGIAGTPYGSAQPPATPATEGKGYWLVGANGAVYAFGDAAYHGSLPGLGIHVADIVGMAATPSGAGYWLVGANGAVYAFGDAAYHGSLPGLGIHVADVVGLVPSSSGAGYWLVGADGAVYAFGDAPFYGSMGGKTLSAPVVSMAAMPGDGGYWLFAADGGVFAFGRAAPPFYGSLGSVTLARPVTAASAVGVTTAA